MVSMQRSELGVQHGVVPHGLGLRGPFEKKYTIFSGFGNLVLLAIATRQGVAYAWHTPHMQPHVSPIPKGVSYV